MKRNQSLNKNNTVILACGSMLLHVKAAQKKMGTNFEVIELDSTLHEWPKKMRRHILQILNGLSKNYENVLVAMGYCGGLWKNILAEKRIVIPKVDDCITLLLHTDDNQHSNLKKVGHMYFRDPDADPYSIEDIKEKLCHNYGNKKGMTIFESWFASYTNANIIDTGVYDCHSTEYTIMAKKNADLIHCDLGYVKGSNLILEKLVSGIWDKQFLVVEVGNEVKEQEMGLDEKFTTF